MAEAGQQRRDTPLTILSPPLFALLSSRQAINYNHLIATRYALDLESLKGAVTVETFKEPSQREDAKKAIKSIFEERYTSGKNRYVHPRAFSLLLALFSAFLA